MSVEYNPAVEKVVLNMFFPQKKSEELKSTHRETHTRIYN